MRRTHPRALAAVVAAALVLAGCGGSDADEGAGDASGGDTLAVTGTDELLWEPETLSADAGTVEFALTCEGGVNHNLVIEDTGETVAECAPGETANGSAELDAGTYTYLCTVPGHETRMIGELTVS